MKKDVENKLILERDRRLRELPDFIADFILSIQEKTSIRTQTSYIKDYTVFLEYLISLPEVEGIVNIRDLTITNFKFLTERDIQDYISYTTAYKKTFEGQNGTSYTQEFTNSQIGKSRKLASIHTLFEWLSRKKENEIQDITKFVEVKVNVRKQIKDSLKDEEIERLIAVIADDLNIETKRALAFHKLYKLRDISMFYILAYTGIRISELVQLDINDIALDEGAMVVIRKGGDQEIVYLPEDVQPILAEYIDIRKHAEGLQTQYKNALFISNQLKRIEARTVRYMLEKYRVRANIDIKLTPHTLRRTFAIKLLDMTNGNVKIVADTLGHRTTTTTERFYVKVHEEKKKKAIEGFGYNKGAE